MLDAARELRARGAVLDTVVCVIDRESGGVAQLADADLALRSLFTMTDLRPARTHDDGVTMTASR